MPGIYAGKAESNGTPVPAQPASIDIWDRKYRLKRKDGTPIDQSVADTLARVARAAAEVEETDEKRAFWSEEFLWALEHGAIPAGRILSNAGAQAFKPETSTINCTVSGPIHDCMDDILGKLHEAGLTLKGGSGIGYEFSTLRPRGAWVAGAGSYTSGPLSFMEIYDRMCFTVSSAGGRRGAQMATFDIGHPDVVEFIRVKREHGLLRQFNLSLLLSEAFMQAVRNDETWKLGFPVTARELDEAGLDLNDPESVFWRDWPITESYALNDQGQVAFRIYRTLPARQLWDLVMASTYDFAEPGCLFIDRINELNNNWFCENIRASNPCVTADTRLATQYGLIPIGELRESGAALEVTVDRRVFGGQDRGTEVRPAKPAFMTVGDAAVFKVVTADGYEIKSTEWHDFYTTRGKIKLRELRIGDELLVQSGKGQFGRAGNEALGILLGLITGDGHFTNRGRGQEAVVVNFWGEERSLVAAVTTYVNSLIANIEKAPPRHRISGIAVPARNMIFIRSVVLARVLEHFGFTRESKLRVPEVIWRGSEDCVKGYLRTLFQTDGTVIISAKSLSCSARLASSHRKLLQEIQILLANFGVFCRIRQRRNSGRRIMPDGKGASRSYSCRADYELIIDGESRDVFMREVGFLLETKNAKYREWVAGKVLRKSQRFTTKVMDVVNAGREAVFDTTQPDRNAVIFNGLVTGQCGEQPLPPYGACLLGSINLTEFIHDPFTEQARFDWDKFRKVVRVFTRLLDNVVELNGLVLPQQRDEILRKRRHGMGFLGLGSAFAMLRMRYGDAPSVEFTERVTRELALVGWQEALALAKEKGPAPIMNENFTVTPGMLRRRPEMVRDGYREGDQVKGSVLHARYSRYMQNWSDIAPGLLSGLAEVGARFTHHSSIAPTGTISLSLANNASNGIEPSYAHSYARNVIREGRKTKEKVDVWSYELLAYRALVNLRAAPDSGDPAGRLPEYFVTAADVSPRQHIDIQAAAQKWIDSSISKTANVPADFPFSEFKDIYLYGYEQGLKGCSTFRFNPGKFQGVLVREHDLDKTVYRFTLESGEVVELRGNEEVEYEGEIHTAANLYDALKEGHYGRY